MIFSDESLSRIEEALKMLSEADEARARKKAELMAKWELYQNQLAKMPEYKPGTTKAHNIRHRINDL